MLSKLLPESLQALKNLKPDQSVEIDELPMEPSRYSAEGPQVI